MNKLGPISAAIASGRTYADYVAEQAAKRRGRKNFTRRSGDLRPKILELSSGVATMVCGDFRFIVDEADAAPISTLNISVMSGRVVVLGDQHIPLPRYLLKPERGFYVDHINGDPLDNRRENLRVCTPKKNAWNMAAQARSATLHSKFKGVSRTGGKWRAYIWIEGKQRHLGVFSEEHDAARAYDGAARAAFGEFCCVNFPLVGEQSAHRGSI